MTADNAHMTADNARKEADDTRITMLCGGVGGARAALALYENFPAENLTFIVNTGDDFEHLGLNIWPDWDTVVYHLADLQEAQRGWGRRDEGTRVMEEFRRLGAPDWFHLGDRDIALHLFRTWALSQGKDSSEVARNITEKMGITSTVLPVTTESLATKLKLKDGSIMDFQAWFVEQQCGPEVAEVLSLSSESNVLSPGVQEALTDADWILLAPSNPYLSLGPMLSFKAFAEAYSSSSAPKWAISPLIGGKAVKGPLDRLIESLSPKRGQDAIADYWQDWTDRLLLPSSELVDVGKTNLALTACSTRLGQPDDRAEFARELSASWSEHQ